MEILNLTYIHQLSAGDKAFENLLISTIKNEFPKEKAIYYKNLKEKKYTKVVENVHKLKHKMSILGLKKSYKIAVKYENSLKEGKINLADSFENILQMMTNYINEL